MRPSAGREILGAALWCAMAVAPPALAADGWRAEFDEACGRTEDAMALTQTELVTLTARCDRLEKLIAGLEETERKVFQKRLAMCRSIYLFVLETKRSGPQPK